MKEDRTPARRHRRRRPRYGSIRLFPGPGPGAAAGVAFAFSLCCAGPRAVAGLPLLGGEPGQGAPDTLPLARPPWPQPPATPRSGARVGVGAMREECESGRRRLHSKSEERRWAQIGCTAVRV